MDQTSEITTIDQQTHPKHLTSKSVLIGCSTAKNISHAVRFAAKISCMTSTQKNWTALQHDEEEICFDFSKSYSDQFVRVLTRSDATS